MIRCETSDVEGTRAIAAALSGMLEDGDLLALIGDLGAGKTAFAQGLAAALGVPDRVTSPTFTLAARYRGRLVFNHLDVYRIDSASESRDLGIEELLEDGVTVIEWADVVVSVLPDDRLDIVIGFGSGDDHRILELTPIGERWQERADVLVAELAQWTVVRDQAC